jgi:hypothetical protein
MATLLDVWPPVSNAAPPAHPGRAQASHTLLILAVLWRHRRAALSLAIGVSAVVAAGIGFTMPRFPATAG